MSPDIFYYDIAAVFVMAVALLSFVMRRKTHTPANRVYFSALLLVTIMTILSLAGELFDEFLGPSFVSNAAANNSPLFATRSALELV